MTTKTKRPRFKPQLKNKKDLILQVRVSEQEKDIFEKFALKRGESLAEVVRSSTLNAASDAGIQMDAFEGFESVQK